MLYMIEIVLMIDAIRRPKLALLQASHGIKFSNATE